MSRRDFVAAGSAAALFGLLRGGDARALTEEEERWLRMYNLFSGAWWEDWNEKGGDSHPLGYNDPNLWTFEFLGFDISGGMDWAAWATQGGGASDLLFNQETMLEDAVAVFYEKALLSFLGTLGSDYGDLSVQEAVDNTMTMGERVSDAISAVVGVATSEGFKKGVGLTARQAMGFNLISATVDFAGQLCGQFGDLNTYEGLSATYTLYRDVLKLLYDHAQDPSLKKAAYTLVLAADECYLWHLDRISGIAAGGAKYASAWFFEVLPKVIESADGDLDHLGLLTAASALVGSLDTGIKIGEVVGNTLVGAQDVFLRYYESAAMAELRAALVAAVDARVLGAVEGDQTLVHDLYRLGTTMVYVDLRGTYCLASILMGDAGVWGNVQNAYHALKEWILDSGEPSPQEWLAAVRNLVIIRASAINEAILGYRPADGTEPDEALPQGGYLAAYSEVVSSRRFLDDYSSQSFEGMGFQVPPLEEWVYALAEISGDSIPELLLYCSEYGDGFGHTLVYTAGSNGAEAIYVGSLYGYGKPRYSPSSRRVEYAPLRGGRDMYAGIECSVRDGLLVEVGGAMHDTWNEEVPYELNGVAVSSDEFEAYFDQYEQLPYAPLATLVDSGTFEATLAEATGNRPVAALYCDDYDGDGTNEAFALVGEANAVDDGRTINYSYCDLWYVSSAGAQLMGSKGNRVHVGITGVRGRKFFVVDSYAGGSSGTSYVYGVREGLPVEMNTSGGYFVFEYARDGAYGGSQDCWLAGGGHVYRYHYFTFDETSFQFVEIPGSTVDSWYAGKAPELYGTSGDVRSLGAPTSFFISENPSSPFYGHTIHGDWFIDGDGLWCVRFLTYRGTDLYAYEEVDDQGYRCYSFWTYWGQEVYRVAETDESVPGQPSNWRLADTWESL